MGNFTKKPIKSYKYNNITVREYKDSRISDKIRLYIVVFIISLIVIVGVTNASYNQSKGICNSKKCEERVERIVSCERFTKSKEKIIECASWKTIFMRKQVTRFERAEIENEVKDLYEKVHEKVGVDLDKIAYAVAMAETGNCTKGYGKTHNNCFGIKHGNTVSCPGVPKGKMCKFESKEESYEAFKKIWGKWYKDYPNYKLAHRWTGGDRVDTWLKHVNLYLKK